MCLDVIELLYGGSKEVISWTRGGGLTRVREIGLMTCGSVGEIFGGVVDVVHSGGGL